MELCVSRATAFTPALATACTPPGTLDLVPRLRPLLGLSTRQPLPRGPSGLQGADQRRGCPGPVGARGRALSGPGCSPRAHRPPGASAYTGIEAGHASVAALVSPRDPAPPGGQEHYTAQEAFTLDGGPAPLHTCNVQVPRLTRPTGAQHCIPSWLGGPEPDSGNCPQGWCREEGRCRGEGPALAVTSTFDQVLLLWPLPQGFVPGPPCPGGHLGPGLSGCLPAAPARVGAMASGSNEAK